MEMVRFRKLDANIDTSSLPMMGDCFGSKSSFKNSVRGEARLL